MKTIILNTICACAILLLSLIVSCSNGNAATRSLGEDSIPKELSDIMNKYMDEVTDYERTPDSTFFLTMLFTRDDEGPKLQMTGCEFALISFINEKYTIETMMNGTEEMYKPVYGYAAFHKNRNLIIQMDNPQFIPVVEHYFSGLEFFYDEEYKKWIQPEYNIDTPLWFYRIGEDYHLSLDSIQEY